VLKSFIRYIHGNVTITFAVAAVPLMAAAGAVIDYSNAQEQRGVVQSALDRASLGARQLAGIVPADEVRAEARKLYQGGVGGRLSVPSPVNVSLADGRVSLGTELHVPTRFLRLIGFDQFVFNLRSEAETGTMTYEVALVLDNSGSMAGSKIRALRDAASDLTRSLFAANRLSPWLDPVRVAVVPFAGAVNVGPDNATAAWVDGKARAPDHLENFEMNARPAAGNRLALFDALSDVTWAGCVEARPHPLDVSDAPPTDADPATLFVPMFAPDEPDLNGFDNNYIADASPACTGADGLPTRTGTAREAEARLCKYTDAAPLPVGHNNGTVVGPNLNCTSSPVMALSDDEPKILAKIASLDARGTTNIHAGVMWGWRLLSSELPFAEGRPAGTSNNRKILIVMSDGANSYDTYGNFNRSMYGAFGYVANGHLGTTSAEPSRVRVKLDERTLEACANASSEGGVQIYTVAFQVSDPATLGLLERCASAPEMAFRTDSNGGLVATFRQIAAEIAAAREVE